MPTIDAARLLRDLHALRRFGQCDNGVVRTALSAADVESRAWLAERFADAGLRAVIDGVGTVFGYSPNDGPAVIVGSHSDTQPQGGWLDGAMGVIYGLEIVRAFADDAGTAACAVDAVAWMDEEGKFGHFMGSRSFFGELSEEEIERACADDGQGFADALSDAGYRGRQAATFEPARQVAYLEAHVEQGGRLEKAQQRIGVVTGIVGIRAYSVEFFGQQNHAGTTAMADRRDAAMGLIRFAYALDKSFAATAAASTVWTFGKVEISPGAESIVPGAASLTVQFRDPEHRVLDALDKVLRSAVQEANELSGLVVKLSPRSTDVAPATMDTRIQDQIAAAAERHAPRQWTRMASGAGHDAQLASRFVASGMLFVPSIGGVSHSFEEDTAEADIVLGCQVLADAVASLFCEFE